MSTVLPMMRAGGLVPLLRWLRANGRPVEEMLQYSGLASFDISKPNNVVPIHCVVSMLLEAARREGPDIMARVVQPDDFRELGGIALVALSGQTAREGLSNVAAAMAKQSTHAQVLLEDAEDGLRVRHFFVMPMEPELLHLSQQSFAAYVRLFCLMTGAPDPVFSKLEIVPHPVHGVDHLKSWFGPNVTASTSHGMTITLGAGIADRQVVAGEHAQPGGGPPEDWVKLRGDGTLSHSARAFIRELFRTGEPAIGVVARMNNLTVRTLQRRLAEEGTSFSALVDEVRRDAVVAMLKSPGTTVQEAAARAGYAAPSGVTRAVRRWTGKPPKQLK